ncbi:hypothetical protein MXB_2607 [Myxobolus squamalis]|nr:hypothetical protein MXB_2607 [Myxobolus squamalis]
MTRLYADGTFVLSPPIFAQIYVLVAERRGFVLPVLYMFVTIRTLWPNLRPVSLSIDFEQTAVSAARFTFPDVSIYSCLFHLTKYMRKKLSDEGLLRRYNTTPDFALAARMIVAIAFVPSHRIDAALEMLSGSYVGRLGRGVRRGALFPFHMWSVYERTLQSLDHTNNHTEAANCRMRAEFCMKHTTIQLCGNSLMESGQCKKGAINTSKDTYEEIVLHRNAKNMLLLMRGYCE